MDDVAGSGLRDFAKARKCFGRQDDLLTQRAPEHARYSLSVFIGVIMFHMLAGMWRNIRSGLQARPGNLEQLKPSCPYNHTGTQERKSTTVYVGNCAPRHNRGRHQAHARPAGR